VNDPFAGVAGLGLAGLRVVVTGGSRGIGAACCRLFARAGASVAVQYREQGAKAEALLAELPATGSHFAFACDVAQADEVERLFAAVRERWGGLDCLVNNAGVWLRDPLSGLQVDVLERTLAINVAGAFRCASAALPLLRGSANASIVNLGSTAGQRGEAEYSAYAASKGAIGAATKSWSTELAPEIRVNCVAPGWVDTEMTAAALTFEARELAVQGIPLRRIASPEDVAGPVLFLASPLARHITGEILNVAAGAYMRN
jgi:3-oxoacyl-[acyl-carrier protein] reductase